MRPGNLHGTSFGEFLAGRSRFGNKGARFGAFGANWPSHRSGPARAPARVKPPTRDKDKCCARAAANKGVDAARCQLNSQHEAEVMAHLAKARSQMKEINWGKLGPEGAAVSAKGYGAIMKAEEWLSKELTYWIEEFHGGTKKHDWGWAYCVYTPSGGNIFNNMKRVFEAMDDEVNQAYNRGKELEKQAASAAASAQAAAQAQQLTAAAGAAGPAMMLAPPVVAPQESPMGMIILVGGGIAALIAVTVIVMLMK
jgi:hypothetical protein